MRTNCAQETLTMLDLRLSLIKSEIEQRTAAEASSVIKHGKQDKFQVSIFDRTSSSSDTAPDTPAFDPKLASAVSTWGFDQHESPKSIKHSEAAFPAKVPDFSPQNFPPMPALEDPGYDSDSESTRMTIQPSQQTVKNLQSPVSEGGEWEKVGPRRKSRARLDVHHRTTKFLENTRYHDRAGAFRAIGGIDPRAIQPRPSIGTRILIPENADGYVENAHNRTVSRGRISGRSSAEVALSQISKSSPPPPRGGGTIMSRRLANAPFKILTSYLGASILASFLGARLRYHQTLSDFVTAFDG